MSTFMIYGATGYTGRLAAAYASKLSLDVVVAGRTEKSISELAASFTVSYRAFSIDDPKIIDAELKDIRVLLNCAGPYTRTANILMDACIRTGVHYLDVSAELVSYQLAEEKSKDAVQAGVMLMPGCGGSVAQLGCLVGYVIQNCTAPASVDVALHVSGSMSRGSAYSAAEGVTGACLQRRDDQLSPQEATNTKNFDFSDGKGDVSCFPVTLPDLITVWKSTGVPNVRTFVHVSGSAFPTGDLSQMPDGPSLEEREANPYHASAVVTEKDGTIKRGVLHSVNGYTFTYTASVEAVRRVLLGQTRAGFQTPVDVFGVKFVESVAGSRLESV